MVNNFWEQVTDYSGPPLKLQDIKTTIVNDRVVINTRCCVCEAMPTMNLIGKNRISIQNYKRHATRYHINIDKTTKKLSMANSSNIPAKQKRITNFFEGSNDSSKQQGLTDGVQTDSGWEHVEKVNVPENELLLNFSANAIDCDDFEISFAEGSTTQAIAEPIVSEQLIEQDVEQVMTKQIFTEPKQISGGDIEETFNFLGSVDGQVVTKQNVEQVINDLDIVFEGTIDFEPGDIPKPISFDAPIKIEPMFSHSDENSKN